MQFSENTFDKIKETRQAITSLQVSVNAMLDSILTDMKKYHADVNYDDDDECEDITP